MLPGETRSCLTLATTYNLRCSLSHATLCCCSISSASCPLIPNKFLLSKSYQQEFQHHFEDARDGELSATSAVQGSKQSHLSRRQDPQKESCSKNAQQHCGQHLSHHGVRWIVAVGRVCVHLYLMVCVCVCARARACVCVRVYVCMCVYAYVYTRTHIHITHTHKHTHTHRYHGISITNNEALRFCRQRQCVCIYVHTHIHTAITAYLSRTLRPSRFCRQRQCVCIYVHTHIHTGRGSVYACMYTRTYTPLSRHICHER